MFDTTAPAIRGKGLTKVYGSTRVVEGVDVAVAPGRIRAIVGENGAGKSTLTKMLTGIALPDEGGLEVAGKHVSFKSPSDAIEHGVAIVHQELNHVLMLSVLDNLLLGHRAVGTRRNGAAERLFAETYLSEVGLNIDPSIPAGKLSAAEAQLLAIAKALSREPKVIIFDEPTAALPPDDVKRLLDLILRLKASGHAILYISHHLSEILTLADDITVLRDGRVVADVSNENATIESLIRLMVGRSVMLGKSDLFPPKANTVLELSNVSSKAVRGLTFELRAGEILGFVGLIGSGMHDAALVIAGEQPIIDGRLKLNGKEMQFRNVSEACATGIALVPEERKTQAIFPDLSIVDNLHAGRFYRYTAGGLLRSSELKNSAVRLIERLRIKVGGLSQTIKTLSGGNQQKVVLARCIQNNPKILVLSDPTRGVDIGAKADIHKLLVALAAEGVAIIVISSEMEEALWLSHRVAVFSEKRLVGILGRDQANPESVMSLATPKRTLEHVS